MKFTNLISRNRGIKRIIRNYKKANWIAINNALNNIDWHSYIDCLDINSAWGKFKNTLNEIYDRNIPNIIIQHKKDMPWFDDEIHRLCVKKGRLRKKYKRTHDPHYKEFSDCRKKFRMTIKTKMRADLNDSSNLNPLTKKFWSYVKNTSNSTSIPDSIHRDHVYAKSHERQAEFTTHSFMINSQLVAAIKLMSILKMIYVLISNLTKTQLDLYSKVLIRKNRLVLTAYQDSF